MKIQTKAHIKALSIDGNSYPVDHSYQVDLEFSAIDTGGRFQDPILDFSLSMKNDKVHNLPIQKDHTLELSLSDPVHEDNKVTFTGKCEIAEKETRLEVNGRLHEEEISRQLISFVLKRFR